MKKAEDYLIEQNITVESGCWNKSIVAIYKAQQDVIDAVLRIKYPESIESGFPKAIKEHKTSISNIMEFDESDIFM